jgi:hypothetical protein
MWLGGYLDTLDVFSFSSACYADLPYSTVKMQRKGGFSNEVQG